MPKRPKEPVLYLIELFIGGFGKDVFATTSSMVLGGS